MLRNSKCVEIVLASTIIMLFGVMSASNMGARFVDIRPGLVTDEAAAACFGGLNCTPTGGSNCADSSHPCGTTGCTATTTTCTAAGTACVMLQTASTLSTAPCATNFPNGQCRAYTQRQCIMELSGPSNYWYSCNYGSYYCNSSTYCGEQLYLQKSS